jgi:DNA-3-methyladenine glycosylase II
MKNYILIDNNSPSISHIIKADPHFSVLFNLIGNIKYILNYDPYVFIIDTIINQMLSNKVSSIISNRLKILCNNKISPLSIDKLTLENIRSIGISDRKVQCIIDFTKIYSKEFYSKKYFKKNR